MVQSARPEGRKKRALGRSVTEGAGRKPRVRRTFDGVSFWGRVVGHLASR